MTKMRARINIRLSGNDGIEGVFILFESGLAASYHDGIEGLLSQDLQLANTLELRSFN